MGRLKADIFDDDPDSPTFLHRKDIMGGKGVFGMLRADKTLETKFNERINEIFRDAQYTVITVLIDKLWMVDQAHWKRDHPYHYLLEILVEKYVQFLERMNSIGDIMPEGRQKKDALLQKEFDRVRAVGTDYIERERIKSALRGKKLKFRTKKDNIAGLQLCDLLAHPSHIYVRKTMGNNVNLGPFATSISNLLVESKYDRSYSGRIPGYGFKHLP